MWLFFAGESKYDNISAKELLKFEAGVCRIPTQNLFCCYCNCYLVLNYCSWVRFYLLCEFVM